jgi:DDE superfamily endonuclease
VPLSAENVLDIGGVQHYIFGDSGYVLRPYFLTPFGGNSLTSDETLFNNRFSRVRIAVECVFKDVKKGVTHVGFPRKCQFLGHQLEIGVQFSCFFETSAVVFTNHLLLDSSNAPLLAFKSICHS